MKDYRKRKDEGNLKFLICREKIYKVQAPALQGKTFALPEAFFISLSLLTL